MMKRIKLLVLSFLWLFAAFAGYSQETTSEIHGLVKEEKGAVEGATIVAIHTPSGTQYATTTRKDGRYNLPNLRIGGPYQLIVTFVGYKDEKMENIFLSLGEGFKGDFTLTSDSKLLTEVIVKTGRQDKIFNNNRNGSQEIVNRTQLERLPTVNRSLNDFTKLSPSANGLSFGGGSSAYNSVTVDGANFTNSFGLGTVGGILGAQTNQTPISLDAIEQIQVSISPFDVRQGGFAGTGINSVTRSGTNEFKGSIYTYIKNENTQGYNVENTVLPKQTLNYNLRGASVGGPIIKNKLFFFASGEQVRQTVPANTYTASDAAHPASNGSVSQVNADTLNALANFLKTKLGYDPGAYQGYSYQTKSDKITARLDYNINKSNTLTLKYNYFKSSADQPPSGSGPAVTGYTSVSRSASFTALPFANAGYTINNNFNIFIAELNTRLSNRASNKLQVGYTAIRDPRSSNSSVFPMVDILSIGGQAVTTSFGYEQFTYGNLVKTDILQLSDIFTYYLGSHEITIGTQNYLKSYLNDFAPQFAGIYQFATLSDFYNSVNNGTGSKFYSRQYSAVPGTSFPDAKSGSTELGFLAQDKWRVANNLTVTYGFRVDYRTFKADFLENPAFGNLTFNGQTYNTGQAPDGNLAFSPRAGFNWDPFNDKKTQVRGGVGLFSGPPPFVWFSNQASNNGILFGQQVSYTSGNTSAVPFSNKVDITPPSATNVPTTYVVNITDPKFKYPQLLKGTLAIDKKLPGDVIVTLEGTYSKDINSIYFKNLNLNEVNGTTLTNGGDDRTRYNSVNNYYPGTAPVTAANPKLSSVILMTNSSQGYAYTGTFQIQKSFKNLYFNAAYTYAVAKNTNELGTTAASLWGGRAVAGDPNSDAAGYASYYQPHRVIATASYRIEYAKNFATSIGLMFEAAPAGTTSFVYNGDLNNDGQTANDLVYIPKSATDINLVKVGSGGLGTGTSTDPRSVAQIWAQVNNYISQDHYLNDHRGEIAERNAAVYPFYKRLDMNLGEDIYCYTKSKGKSIRHTLRLTMDLINVGNFLNKNWGLYKTPNNYNSGNGTVSFLKYEGLAADGKTPSFSFPYLDAANQVPLTSTYTNNTASTAFTPGRWQMQFGIRYIFN